MSSFMIVKNHLKISKTICTVLMVAILYTSLILAYTSFVNLPISFAQTTITNSIQTSKSEPPLPPQIGPSPELSATQSSSTNKTCTLIHTPIKLRGTPQETEGPYFVDGMPNRSDIRSDPSTGMMQQGIPLRLVIHVYSVDSGICTPIKKAKVDIWHANFQGVYSAVQDFGTTGTKFLRGYQLTDGNGTVRFTTIYPGWYQGRAIHIHDKVRTFNGSEKTMEWTSQLYFNNAINEQVHRQFPYIKHGPPTTANEEDGIYIGPSTDGLLKSNSGEHLMLNLTKQGQSYLGTFNIVLNSQQT